MDGPTCGCAGQQDLALPFPWQEESEPKDSMGTKTSIPTAEGANSTSRGGGGRRLSMKVLRKLLGWSKFGQELLSSRVNSRNFRVLNIQEEGLRGS